MVAKHDMESSAPMSEDLSQVLEQFLAGRVHLELLLATVSSALDDDLNCAHDLQEQLDDALRAGTLPEQVWERITAEIDQAISEDEPTEWSEDSPATPPQLRGLLDASGAYPAPAIPMPVSGKPPVLDDPVSAAQPKQPAGPMEPGKLLGDRYVIVSRVKTGGMGDIYKALDRRKKESGAPDPWVAIKVLGEDFAEHPQALATLEREAAHSRKLDHQNIIRVFDFDHSGERCFITMEWLEGESLVDIMDRAPQQPLPESQARQIIQGLGAALIHAHEHGVVHADIKPGNVFVDHAGEAKLLDFGVARAAAATNDVTELNALTPAYCSCEVLEGQAATPADDLFSFGLLAYRALAGHRAFGRVTAIEAEAEGCEPERLDSLNDNEWRAMQTALAFRREERPADVASFMTAFNEAVVAPQGTDTSNTGPVTELLQPQATHADLPPDEPTAQAADNSTMDEAVQPENLPAQARQNSFRKVALWVTPLLLLSVAAVFWIRGQEEPDRLPLTEVTPEPRPAPPVAPAPAAVASGEVESEAVAAATPAVTGTLAADMRDTPPAVAQDDTAQNEPTEFIEPAAEQDATLVGEEDPAATGEPPGPGPALESVEATPEPGVQLAANVPARTISPVPEPVAEPAPPELASSEANTRRQDNSQTAATSGAADTSQADRSAPERNDSGGALADTPTEAALDTAGIQSMPGEAATDAAGELASVPVPMGPPKPAPAAPKPPTEYGPAPVPAPTGPRQVPMSELEFERFVEPRFPRRVAARRASGWVRVEFLINQNGTTQAIRILESEPPEIFDQAAIDAVEKWQFKPPRVEGVAEEVRTSVRLRFEPQR